MTTKNPAMLICRCMAIYALLQLITHIPLVIYSALAEIRDTNFNLSLSRFPLWNSFGGIVLMLFVFMAVWLWFDAERISQWMTKGMNLQNNSILLSWFSVNWSFEAPELASQLSFVF